MYKVMIVEDEMLVRIGLKNSVEWSKFDLEVAADFPDGQAAWDYYEREKPDVVITDICMPKMDGMELIANIRKNDKDTRVVVLSCLEEFELVRKAMTLGVSNYILKLTMTEEEIEQVLGTVREELDGRMPQKGEAVLPAPNLDLMKEKMFKDFMFYHIFSPEEFGRFAAQFNLRLTASRLVVCVMEVDRYARLKDRFRDEYGHLVKMTLLNMLGEIMATHKRGEAFQIDDRRYALVIHFGDIVSEQSIVQEVGKILTHIQDMIRLYFNGSVSFGISGIRSGFAVLPKLYGEAQRALERKFIAGPGQYHQGEQPADPSSVLERLDTIRAFIPVRSLLTANRQQEYDDFLDSLERELSGDRKSLEIMMFRFVQWISSNLYDNHHHEKMLLTSITENLEDCDTLPDMLDEVITYIGSLAEQIRNRLQMSGEITKAIQYIKQHYTENISLQTVADHVGLSSSYLSSLFRKELQISFIDYLNRYRIERAKELLTEGRHKPSDVAVMVGFSPEYTYFSKVFKKITGLNPNEYRRQMLPPAVRKS